MSASEGLPSGEAVESNETTIKKKENNKKKRFLIFILFYFSVEAGMPNFY